MAKTNWLKVAVNSLLGLILAVPIILQLIGIDLGKTIIPLTAILAGLILITEGNLVNFKKTFTSRKFSSEKIFHVFSVVVGSATAVLGIGALASKEIPILTGFQLMIYGIAFVFLVLESFVD